MHLGSGVGRFRWDVYGQSNETNSQSENVIQIIPETPSEENNENTNQQLTSESGSSGMIPVQRIIKVYRQIEYIKGSS